MQSFILVNFLKDISFTFFEKHWGDYGFLQRKGNEDSDPKKCMEMPQLLQTHIKQNKRSSLIPCLSVSCSQGHSEWQWQRNPGYKGWSCYVSSLSHLWLRASHRHLKMSVSEKKYMQRYMLLNYLDYSYG